jgi:undecaprenyl diphosphate synthase
MNQPLLPVHYSQLHANPLSAITPQHVAIIMDGNGRWATARGKPRLWGHKAGLKSIENVVRAAIQSSVRYVTLFAFSTENWSRPPKEVLGLMAIFRSIARKRLAPLVENGVRLAVVGDIKRLPSTLQKVLHEAVEETARGTQLTLTIALSYSGQDEIVKAFALFRDDVLEEHSHPAGVAEEVTSATLRRYLWLSSIPEPDLLIRTGGEVRLSNFMLWHLAYTELYFTPTLWPDFTEADFISALEEYGFRQRRFGRL